MVIILSSIIVIILVIPFFLIILSSLLSYLSRPKDLAAAKNRGFSLLKLKGQTVMVVVAHPDDVDWYTGGTLSVLHYQGNRIIVVVATSGEKGGGAVENLSALREAEQLKAAKIMGYDQVEFLRFPDRYLQANAKFVSKLKDLLSRYKPSVIFTFDTEKESFVYRHSDHQASGKATLKALEDYKNSVEIYLFHSRANNTIFDVTKVQPLKTKALAAHASQRNLRFSRIVRHFPFNLLRFPRAGAAMDFESVGIEYGEVFRHSR